MSGRADQSGAQTPGSKTESLLLPLSGCLCPVCLLYHNQSHAVVVEPHQPCRSYSMAKVCQRCADPAERITPQLVAGQPFHPQTCARPSAAAMKTMHAGFGAAAVAEHLMDRIQAGREAVVETKFDGWRLGVHITDAGGVQSVRRAPAAHVPALRKHCQALSSAVRHLNAEVLHWPAW